jgi:hypothetical protein
VEDHPVPPDAQPAEAGQLLFQGPDVAFAPGHAAQAIAHSAARFGGQCFQEALDLI